MGSLRLYNKAGFPSLFNDFFSDVESSLNLERFQWNAPTNISESEDKYVVSVEVPGYQKENLDIQYAEGVLSVSGNRDISKESEDENYHLVERKASQFKRAFRIPDIDADKIDAHYDNGILTVSLPKEEVRKAKKISIASRRDSIEGQ